MLLKRALIVAVLIIVIYAFAGLSQKVEAAPNLTVINTSGYKAPMNLGYWLFGELENSGNKAATNIYINVSFYDSSDNFINSTKTSIGFFSGGLFGNTFVLNPGAKVGFWTTLWAGGALVNHYDFAMSFDESANDKPAGLEILSCTVTNLGYNDVNVNGTVKNIGATDQTGIDFYATIYDSGGKVVGTTWLSYIDQSINPGEEIQFSCDPLMIPKTPYVEPANFEITAQSFEYVTASAYTGSVVPEFPLFLAPMLLMAAATITLVFYKKKQN